MSIWHWIGDALLAASFVAVGADSLRFRRRIMRERAQAAATALVGINVVDGIELPRPEDPRWVEEEVVFTRGDTCMSPAGVLMLGEVVVSVNPPELYIGAHSPRIDAGVSYAVAVVRAHRQRVAAAAMKAP